MLFIITVTLLSCDHPASHDYYIENDCKQDIVIDVVDGENSESSFTIKPLTKELIFHGETINKVSDDDIIYYIKSIDIYKEGIKINIDPMDYKLWQYESNSKYSATSILYVKTGNF
jgi:hypothetical protein